MYLETKFAIGDKVYTNYLDEVVFKGHVTFIRMDISENGFEERIHTDLMDKDSRLAEYLNADKCYPNKKEALTNLIDRLIQKKSETLHNYDEAIRKLKEELYLDCPNDEEKQ